MPSAEDRKKIRASSSRSDNPFDYVFKPEKAEDRKKTKVSSSVWGEPGLYSDACMIDEPSMHPGMWEPKAVVDKKLAMADLICEAEAVIKAIRDGEIEGEYFEF